jgi:hypothetical protein
MTASAQKPISNNQPSVRNSTGSFTQGITSPADVTGNQNSQFKYNQESEGPYQEMTKNAGNKYLEKIAISRIANNMKNAFKESSHIAKASLLMSGTGLGLSAANYNNGKITAITNQDKANLERRSLAALQNINRTLSSSTIVPSAVPALRQSPKKL